MIALAYLVSLGISGRWTLSLNEGWEFARIPNPPSIWKGADAVPTSAWRVMRVSSEETAQEDGKATNAFDGNPRTIWHTEWSKRQAPYPHELIVDLGSEVEVTGLRLLPRQTTPNNGRPNHFKLFLSEDPTRWGTPLLDDSVPDTTELYTRAFGPTKSRYMRLLFADGHRPEPFLALSEIGLMRRTNRRDQQNWATQYNIGDVTVGGNQYDLTGASLDAAKALELRAVRDRDWRPATLPHAAWIRPLGSSEIWQGVAYYRRRLDRPQNAAGKRLEFILGAAMQNSDLWLNGIHVASQKGGYLPLSVDLTPFIKQTNELLIRVDNRDNPLIPPGKPQQELDFMYGNGLYRNARLVVTDLLRVTDPLLENRAASGGVYVTFPKVNALKAVVRIRTHIRNSHPKPVKVDLRQRLIDADNLAVASTSRLVELKPEEAKQFTQNLDVKKPKLWSTGSPNLYSVETDLVIDGKTVDSVLTRVGIRRIEATRSRGFVLNGKPIRLIGTNRHQDYPWVGPALSDAANARDALQIKRAGHNIVRLSHYPQSEAFLDECDRIGLLTIPCIPGWQFINNDPRFTSRVAQDIRELIRRDRNHPCVAFWETSLNETYPPAATARTWSTIAKSESQDDNILTAGDAAKGADWDIAYNQWREDLSRPQDGAPDRPGYIREYGDYEFGGAYSTSRVRIGEGIDKLLKETWNHVWSHNKFLTQYPWTLGDGTWEMFDHNVPWEFRVSASGLSDLFRRQKPSYWFYASQQSAPPMLKIAATWQPGAPKRNVVVFTNCDEARLSINGRLIATAKPHPGPATDYSKAQPFDGSNTANLPHPPIVFRDVAFIPGKLIVSGIEKGRSVCADLAVTAGKPVRLKLWVDDLGIPSQPNDLVFLRAALVDDEGRINPDAVSRIRFTVSGAAIAGETVSSTEMGVATVLIRTSTKSAQFKSSAVSAEGQKGDL